MGPKFHHILYCSNFSLIESFFKEVLLFEEGSFQKEKSGYLDFLSPSLENDVFYLTFKDTRVFFLSEKLHRERSPFLIQFQAEEWGEIQQRIEFWQYRHRSSLEDFVLNFSERSGTLSDPNGQSFMFTINLADSCFIHSATDLPVLDK